MPCVSSCYWTVTATATSKFQKLKLKTCSFRRVAPCLRKLFVRILSDSNCPQLCETELAHRRKTGAYKGSFSALSHFFGYEGRSGLPSDFDCNYCYTLGIVAVALLQRGCNGLMSCARALDQPVQQWVCGGIPLTSLMAIERRKGRDVPVIRKALVELSALPFQTFTQFRQSWALEDAYSPTPSIYTLFLCIHSLANQVPLCRPHPILRGLRRGDYSDAAAGTSIPPSCRPT